MICCFDVWGVIENTKKYILVMSHRCAPTIYSRSTIFFYRDCQAGKQNPKQNSELNINYKQISYVN